MYFSTLCSLRWFAVDFFAVDLHTALYCRALTLALARLSCFVYRWMWIKIGNNWPLNQLHADNRSTSVFLIRLQHLFIGRSNFWVDKYLQHTAVCKYPSSSLLHISETADRMDLLPVGPNPKSRPATFRNLHKLLSLNFSATSLALTDMHCNAQWCLSSAASETLRLLVCFLLITCKE